ncbi:MAG: glycoside hydrolase family 16 protein [Planctomycetota bacterium]|nr:MAG: glycoside hydrolase family 16 protein [Planctomycetota bacterium]
MMNRRYLFMLAAATAALLYGSPAPAASPDDVHAPEAAEDALYLPPLPPGKKWKLIWSDEFEGTEIDRTKWKLYGDGPRKGGFWMKEDCYLDGKGHLVIRTKKDGDRYTSGAMGTDNSFHHRYGYWVCRCTHPKEPGMWAAFWLQSSQVGRIGDEGRDGTEIDVIEMPYRDGTLTSNLHWDGYGKEHKHDGIKFKMPEALDGFHTYGLWWKPDEYVFDVDGKVTWRTNSGGVSQSPEYMKLSVEIGSWAGDIAKARLPEEWFVDYVRVYEIVDE